MSLAEVEPYFFSVRNHHFVMRPVIRTDREAIAAFARNNENVLTGPFPVTIAALTGKRSEAAGWLHGKIDGAKERKGLFCVIQELETREIIGFVSAFQFEWRTPKCELSWMISPKYQKNGIAYQCCRYMIRFLFAQAGLLKILCRISPDNEASIQLASKLGFQKEGLHQRDFRDGNDNLLDVLYFGLLA